MKKMYHVLLSLVVFAAVNVNAQAPYAHYPLDGNAIDISGNNLTGTISGSPVATTNRYNQTSTALNFNGSSDYIDLPSAFDFSSRSVIAWFNASQIGSANGYNVIYMSDGPHLQYGLTNLTLYTDGTFGDIVRLNVGGEVFNASINTNEWYQVAITRTPAVAKFYLNGVLVFTQNNPGSAASNNGAVVTAVVGADRGYAANFFGKIDDLRIYNSELNDTAIVNNYSSLKNLHAIDDKLNVFVNNGNVTVQFNGESESVVAVTLTDLTGKMIAQQQGAYSGVMNETELPAGAYFVSVAVKEAARPVTRKVVVAK